MASDGREDDVITVSVPPGVDDWLDEQAARHGKSRADVCRRFLSAATEISAADSRDRLPNVDESDLLRDQLEAQREEFIDHVEDVRERVIQVKRETDDHAPREHTHDRYADSAAVASVEADVDAIDATLETLDARIDEGFDNYETILERLSADVERVSERTTVLASAVLDLRDMRAAILERDRRRAAADELKIAANRLDVSSAMCEECESTIDLSLLTEPFCPHCAASIADVERRVSILGSHTLVTGDPPALPATADPDGPDREALEAAADTVDSPSNERSHD